MASFGYYGLGVQAGCPSAIWVPFPARPERRLAERRADGTWERIGRTLPGTLDSQGGIRGDITFGKYATACSQVTS